MKRVFFLLVFSIIIFIGCNKEEVNNPDDISIKPPTQVGEIDLVGFANEIVVGLAVNRKEPWNILVSTKSPNRVYVSRNYGVSWNLSVDTLLSSSMVWSNINPGIAYLSRNEGQGIRPYLIKTTNYGESWFNSDSGLFMFDEHITRILTHHTNDNVLYLLTKQHPMGMPNAPGTLWASMNGGLNFTLDVDNKLYNSEIYFPSDIANNNILTNLIFLCANSSNVSLNDYVPIFAFSSDGGMSWSYKILDSINLLGSLIYSYNNLTILLFGKGRTIDFNSNKFFIKKPVLFISSDYGVTFRKLDDSSIDFSQVNDLLITPENYIVFTAKLKSDPYKSVIYISKDQGQSFQQLVGNDYDSKTFLAYDSKNKFLYVVKNEQNKGLYRIKLN